MFTFQNVAFKNLLKVEDQCIDSEKTTVLIGASGSGKSTFLWLLNRLNTPTTGTISFCGKPLASYSPVLLRRRVAMMSQSPALFPGDLENNLQIARRFAALPPANEALLSEVLTQVALEEKKLTDDVTTFSGGERQRLGLARLLLIDPEVFLLDEPTSALDSQTQARIMTLLTTLVGERHKTLIMVTHSQDVAQDFADHLILVKDHLAKPIDHLPEGVVL